jgi:hypothetical protein
VVRPTISERDRQVRCIFAKPGHNKSPRGGGRGWLGCGLPTRWLRSCRQAHLLNTDPRSPRPQRPFYWRLGFLQRGNFAHRQLLLS